MASTAEEGDSLQHFYVGQHESNRIVPVTAQLLNQALDCGVGIFLSSAFQAY